VYKIQFKYFSGNVVSWWRKDISQQIWDSRNYQLSSYFVSTVIMAGTLQFKRHPSSSFS